MRLAGPLVLLVLAATACSSSSGGGAGAPSAGAPLPLFPMALVSVGPREAGEPIGELRADGAIVTKHGDVIARLLPDRVVSPDGKPKIVVTPSGDVVLDPRTPAMHFDGRGALVSPAGDILWVDEVGTPSWVAPGHGLPAMDGVRFTPFTPAARRTAEVLLIIFLEAAWSKPLT